MKVREELSIKNLVEACRSVMIEHILDFVRYL